VKRLAAVVVLAVLANPLYAVEMPQPTPQSTGVFSGSAAVQALGWVSYEVSVGGEGMTQPRLVGRITASGGTGNDIVVAVLTDADFVNWKNNHTTHPLFNSGQVTVADLSVDLPGSGTYYLVFSNGFSAMTPKTVSGQVNLHWIQIPSAAEVAAAKAQTDAEARNQLLADLGIILLCGALIGGIVAWAIASRRNKRRGTEKSGT
jgi:hypothetical protein